MDEGNIQEKFQAFLSLAQNSVARVDVLELENSKLRTEMLELQRINKEKDLLLEEKNAEIEELLQKQKSVIADFRGTISEILVALRTSTSVEHYQFVAQSANAANVQLKNQLMLQKNEIERLNRMN